jgi:hypothetical protein
MRKARFTLDPVLVIGTNARNGSHAERLLDERVRTEARGQAEGDPRWAAGAHDEHEHPCHADADRRPLQWTRTFPEHEYAEQHHDEWVDEVAHRRVDHPAAGRGVDEQAPVDRGEQRRDSEQDERARLA